ncbi:hypothetical protein BJ878DRAFT_531424 [Calycina marina]|uniref:Myb-like domain-containing protein n=1 Tax=Calycina marina TaxID=1763456 RepID=A0A9P7ZCA7_9HELO|nr:hypothetical protein BJ878DRAFT_531424 [Calycina marina]
MPKGHRTSKSQGYYRMSPISSTPITSSYPSNTAMRPTIQTHYYNAPIPVSMPQQSYQSYNTGGPVQPLSYPTMSLPQTTPTSTSIRTSSGAWSPQDDAALMQARAQGMNWAPIQQSYFPGKSPNACRKRHERLMTQRSADDWDGRKLELLAKTYMNMRREIWQGLAQETGESWKVVEAKCMQQGLKNLATSARACVRRERTLETNSLGVNGGYGDDSGIGDEFEAEFDADGASQHSGRSNGTNGTNGYYGHHSRLPSISMEMGTILNRDINGRHDVQPHH